MAIKKTLLIVNTSCGIRVEILYQDTPTNAQMQADALAINKQLCGDKPVEFV